MNKVLLKFRRIKDKIFGMKLLYRMIFFYIIGGVLPMILTGNYLINGMSDILLQQQKEAKVVEVETMKRQILESLNTINTVSKYFFFDKELENIAFSKYHNYQDNVNDFRAYTAFGDYSEYNSDDLQRIRVYIKNNTMAGNSQFIKVDEKINDEYWYQDALSGRGAVIWRYIPNYIGNNSFLSLARLIRTSNNRDVGVLVIDVRNKKFLDIMNDWDSQVLFLLNKKDLIKSTGDIADLDTVIEQFPDTDPQTICKNIIYQGEEHLMTYADISLPESTDRIQIVSLQSYKDILKEASKKSKSSELFYLLSIGISAIMIVLFSKSFSLRVNFFCKQMQKAAGGDFKLDKKLKGNDEICTMYDYLNTMISSIQSLISEVYEEQLQKERLKTKQRDAEFKMLASQINPHFLYNTLETIRMKARARGENDIEELVKMLAKILRNSVQVGNSEVTISSEVKFLVYYLKIQQYRFGERIQYHINIDKELEDKLILPLIMQPIVENSIVHGLEAKEGIGNINITIKKHNENVISIVIEDDGMGIESSRLNQIIQNLNDYETIKTSHIGISNVHQRVRLHYGDAYGIQINSERGIGTKVEIIIPNSKA